MLCQFFSLELTFYARKNPYFEKHLFCKTRTDYAYKLRVQDFATGKNLCLISALNKRVLPFFSGKLFYKSNRKLFSCVCISWYKHSRGWENSRQLCKPSTLSQVCITVSNSPNPSRVYIRLCKHEKRFLLLKCPRATHPFGVFDIARYTWLYVIVFSYCNQNLRRTPLIKKAYPRRRLEKLIILYVLLPSP